MSQWNTPYTLLREELTQRRDEGVVVPATLRAEIDALDPVVDAWNEARIGPLYDAVAALPGSVELANREPNDLAQIRRLRPDGPRDLHWQPSENELHDRLHGAWTGRATGCALGKPVELIGVGVCDNTLVGRSDIKAYLSARGDWPLTDYFSGRDMGDGKELWAPRSTREHIAFMEADDDIHYTLVALGVLEEHGPDFTWMHVADWWMRHVPMADICTAEAQAMLNFMHRTARWGSDGGARLSATPEYCRSHRNPYREWIGAQIRSDGWAWACAGKPELAAELAYRDASWTHERNGIYDAMFFAAVQAAAFVVDDPYELVEIGLSEIPEQCRLAKIVRATVAIVVRLSGREQWEEAMAQVESLCNQLSPPVMSPVHTINDAAICVLSILLGAMDTLDSVTMSVMAGLDTDCNGATVGSIVGAASGRELFRNELAARLHDTIRPNLIGFHEITMTELTDRMAVLWHAIDLYARGRGTESGVTSIAP